MYNVGFGDCFLLTFRYAGGDRHALIDFGSNARGDGFVLADLANQIAADCGGKLSAVVLSHRHRDHIKGFDPAVGGGVIKGLAPELVLRPWTEDPAVNKLPSNQPGVTERKALVQALAAGQDAAELVTSVEARPGVGSVLRARLNTFAVAQLKNSDAVHLLDELSEDGRGQYLSAGMPVDVEPVLPGVRITVLGPPLPDAWPAVKGERADDPEYWFRVAETLPAALNTEHPGESAIPGPEAWLADQLRAEGLQSALRIVLGLDSALNNTSLILLIEAAGRRLLFPGDAQIENWSYSFRPEAPPDVRAKLSALDVYKVGHHGSRNATPKLNLLPLWQAPGVTTVPVAMMSTLLGPYDENHPVPSDALVHALAQPPLRMIRTDDLPPGSNFADLELSAVPGGNR
jgi:hypothetical protein